MEGKGSIMKNELIIKKCMNCGATVKIIDDCNCKGCGITCCDVPMQVLTANSVDAAVEKHIPTYEVSGDEIIVKVNHVMESEHFIEWISLVDGNKEYTVRLNPGQEATCKFPYLKGATLYAYCNKHGLWKTEVE